jgi:hypothetical protein
MPGGELVTPLSFSQKFAVPAVPVPAERSRQSNCVLVLASLFWIVLFVEADEAWTPSTATARG